MYGVGVYVYILSLVFKVVFIDCRVEDGRPVESISFGDEILLSHNVYRMKHKSPPLKWSDELAKEAYKIQQASNDCQIPHTYPAGTNFLVCGKGLTPQDVIDTWYYGLIDYDFYACGLRRRNSNTLNFTQLVWKGTEYVGCSMSVCGNNVLWVCRYSPEGNFQGHFCQNVGSIDKAFDVITPLTNSPIQLN